MNRAVTQVAWELAAIEKGKYAFHTLKEIHEQPVVVEKVGSKNLIRLEEFCNILRNSENVFLTGERNKLSLCFNC